MKVLILLRGLPGAGKSTLAGILSENRYPVYSVDDYFTDPETGAYTFKHNENHLAYQQCETNTQNAMEAGHSKIFVHNTFTLQWEMEPYLKLAAKHQYAIHVVTVENYHDGENIHGIPREQLEKMAAKYPLRLL